MKKKLTEVFFFFTLNQILKVEKHKIQEIIAQGGSSFCLGWKVRCSTINVRVSIKDVAANEANDDSSEKKDQKEANGNNSKHCRNKTVDYFLKHE